MLQPDPFPGPDSSDPSRAAESNHELPPGPAESDVAHLVRTLAVHGGGASFADLALDLVLNEIVEQARLATTATGAAIALSRGDEMVCRATSGANAPDLGVGLNTRSGLSGACVRTRQVQRCDDTEKDPRVDSAVSRSLEVRSVLVVPVLNGEELAGVFEIFSPLVSAFSERDVQTLQALSRRIVYNMGRATETPGSPLPALEASSALANTDETVVSKPVADEEPLIPKAQSRPRDHWTDILNAIVIALALLLGWMVGRVGWQQATGGPSRITAPNPHTAQPTPPSSQTRSETSAQPSEKKAAVAAAVPRTPKPQPKSTAGTEAPAADGLVVYEKGKVIFRLAPAASHAGARLASGQREPGTEAALISVSPEIANTYLVQRVEPNYPDAARQQHIQGPVVLDAVVGKDGIVREVTVISGDFHLTAAAVNAVRQWRFKPYQANGSPVDFRTQITLNFTVP
jgi:TonB family protein